MKKIVMFLLSVVFSVQTDLLLAAKLSPDIQAMKERIESQLMAPDRISDDVSKDAARPPFEYYHFLGLRPGMIAADLGTSTGYSLEIIAAAVGPEGEVYGQNSPRMLKFRDGMIERGIKDRLAGNRLPNAQHIVADLNEVEFPRLLDFAH